MRPSRGASPSGSMSGSSRVTGMDAARSRPAKSRADGFSPLALGATAIGGAAGYLVTWLVPRQIGFAGKRALRRLLGVPVPLGECPVRDSAGSDKGDRHRSRGWCAPRNCSCGNALGIRGRCHFDHRAVVATHGVSRSGMGPGVSTRRRSGLVCGGRGGLWLALRGAAVAHPVQAHCDGGALKGGAHLARCDVRSTVSDDRLGGRASHTAGDRGAVSQGEGSSCWGHSPRRRNSGSRLEPRPNRPRCHVHGRPRQRLPFLLGLVGSHEPPASLGLLITAITLTRAPLIVVAMSLRATSSCSSREAVTRSWLCS